VTGAAAVLAASPVAGRRCEFPGVLAGIALDGPAARLTGMLDLAFLAGAGWDPVSRVLSLPAGHPLLGRTLCRADGCPATVHGTKAGGLCWSCFARLRRAGLSIEEIAASPQVPAAPPRPAECLVPECERMSPGGRQGQRTGLCLAHSRRFRRKSIPACACRKPRPSHATRRYSLIRPPTRVCLRTRYSGPKSRRDAERVARASDAQGRHVEDLDEGDLYDRLFPDWGKFLMRRGMASTHLLVSPCNCRLPPAWKGSARTGSARADAAAFLTTTSYLNTVPSMFFGLAGAD
jgi:hypothetical protein